MSFAQVAKGYLSTIANKNSFSLITNMRVASVSTDWVYCKLSRGWYGRGMSPLPPWVKLNVWHIIF